MSNKHLGNGHPADRADVLKQARLVHTSTLAASLTLLVVLAADSPQQLTEEAGEVTKLAQVVRAIPDSVSLVDSGRPDEWYDCAASHPPYEKLTCISKTDRGAVSFDHSSLPDEMLSRYVRDDFISWFNRPRNVRPVISNAFTISSAETLWNSLSHSIQPAFWVIGDYFLLRCLGKAGLTCTAETEEIDILHPSDKGKARYPSAGLRTLEQVTKEVGAHNLAKLPPRRGGGTYEGWLLATGSEDGVSLVVPLSKYKTPPITLAKLFTLSPRCPIWFKEAGWQPFAVQFPKLAASDPTIKALSLTSAASVLTALSTRFSESELKLLGLELRVKNVATLGLGVLVALLVYLWLHLVELGKGHGTGESIAWIAVYKAPSAEAVTILSFLAPGGAAAYIAVHSGGLSNPPVFVPAAGAVALSLLLVYTWFKHIRPRLRKRP